MPVLPAHCTHHDYRHIACRIKSTFVGKNSDWDKNAKGIVKKKAIKEPNAPSQNKLKFDRWYYILSQYSGVFNKREKMEYQP